MVVGEANINNIMGGIENTGSVRLHNHKRKLKQRFDIIKKLGQGTYGKVQLGINKETGQEVAIKTIKKSKIDTEADLIRIRREIQIMSSVQHPNIIHIYEVFENREKMVLVMEYAAGGELYDYLSERKVLVEEEARRIFRQISTACYYCHKHKICHRDLKLENILLDENRNAKIADFGLSNVFDDQRLLSTFCGSPLYASPEIVKGTPYHGPEVDCWSLGVLLYTLVYGAMPFDGSNFKRLVKQISQGDYFEPKNPSPASPLIQEMLTVNPKHRANIEKICAHWWVNEGYEESCLEISEELANQTPVRLDVLLSLNPPPSQLESDKLVLTGEVNDQMKAEPVVPTRSQSVGSLMEIVNPSEKRIKDLIVQESKVTPKRKLETTVSSDQANIGKDGKRKEKIVKEHTVADISVSGQDCTPDVEQDVKMSDELPAGNDKGVEEEIIDESLLGAVCAEIIEENKKSENKKPQKVRKTLTSFLSNDGLEKVHENPSQESLHSRTTQDNNKENTVPLPKPIPDTAKVEVQEEKAPKEVKTPVKKLVKKKVVAKKETKDDSKKAEVKEEPKEIPAEPPAKPVERRQSRIFEQAEKFQNMISSGDNKTQSPEKPKKIIIPGVSVGGFKKEFERKASLKSVSPPKLKSTTSKKHIIDEKPNSTSNDAETKTTTENFGKETEVKTEANGATKTETSEVNLKDEPSVKQPTEEDEHRKKLKNAVSIISNALDKEGTRKSKSRPCMTRKPPVPFGSSGRSASGSIAMISPLSPPSDNKRVLKMQTSLPSNKSAMPVGSTAELVKSEPEPLSPPENKTSSAEITLKSATLPRRKSTKAEIQLEYPKPKPATIEFKTEMSHPIQAPPVLTTQRSEVMFPVNTPPQVIGLRSSSLEPEIRTIPKERIIPIAFESPSESAREPIQSPPTKPPMPRMFSTQKSSQRSNSLSRQSTEDSDKEGSVSGEPIKKSPREYIIPIAVEGGGYVTPRAGSLEPSDTSSNVTNASRKTSSSKLGRPRRMMSLFDRDGSEDESPFGTIHRHSSFGRDSDTEGDSRKDAFHMHRLRSSRPRKATLEHNDSLSSGEDDDDEDGFEFLTAENLFSTLLSRVRDLTHGYNDDGSRTAFPKSRLLGQSKFWNRMEPLTSARNSPLGRQYSREHRVNSTMGVPWRRSVSRDLASDIDNVFNDTKRTPLHSATLPRGGGELIDAYNVGGQAEVEKLIKEQFGQLMYQEGAGQIINRSEYLRWKFRDCEQVVLPIEASLSPHDPLAKWVDHEACWQMQYRGSLGETLIHVLIMCDTKIHTRIARTLIRCFPKLAIDVVEGEEYLGAGSLHLAIAYNNNELVQDLVEAGANVNQRAVGSFFLPRDQQRPKPAKYTDYEGLAYLGEYPLAWAACCANESVYNLLLDTNAHPDYQDSFGNMILHMVVVCDKLDMFGYALRHPKQPASNGIANTAGLTPLTLACKLGRAEVFREMLELSAKEFWRYSNITCSAYPLNALDTLLPDGRTNWNSALFIILNGTKEEHLDMLDGGIIQRLLEEKWKTFARNQFLKRLLILMLHLLCLSVAVYLRPDDPDEPLLGYTEDPVVISRYIAEVGTVLGVLSYLILQQGDEIKNQGLVAFLKQQYHSPPKLIFLIANILILFCIVCRLQEDRITEEALLLVAVPGSWFLLMFFAGAVRLTGPFVTMIYSMITGDMLTFGIIYAVFLFGFSQTFYFLYKGFPGVKSTLYGTYSTTWMALFQITLGNYDYTELANTTYPAVSRATFALFMVFVPILLLNMLIAMMGNTYAHVIEQSEKEWMKQWAKIVISLERAIPQADAHHYLQEYSISLGPSELDPSIEQRGVMVIKSKSKTRAKQRKGAVANWKRVGKVTINALKKKNMTGEEMRCLMWGRESINTPVKVKGPKIDPLLDPHGPTIQGAFEGALTATLEVISIAHDVKIDGQPQKIQNPKPTPAEASVLQKNLINSGLSIPSVADKGMYNALSQLSDSQVPPPQVITQMTPSVVHKSAVSPLVAPPVHIKNATTSEDPLRDLVLYSKVEQPQLLNDLASKAANLSVVEEVTTNTQAPSVGAKSLVGIFAGTENFVKKVEETIKKKYTALDPSDSEGYGEVPLLGRISRTKRAKSATQRKSCGKLKSSDKRKLLKESESSSTDTVQNTEKQAELDYVEDRMRQVKESLKQDFNGMDYQSLRPINIDIAVGAEQVFAPKSQVLNVQGEGAGHENLSANEKPIRRKRPKTAKLNRVSPIVVDTAVRSCQSAVVNLNSDDVESDPDPLEPWSTKGIANMNKILAWENEPESL